MIDIVDDTNMYPALLGIEWVIDNQTITNFKKRILMFEDSDLQVITPIDTLEGNRYIEKVDSEGQGGYLDNIYNIMSAMDYYVNPMAEGNLSWRGISSCTSDSQEALENW